MIKAIDVDGFEKKFAHDPDPWGTFANHDESHKRRAIERAIGSRKYGRVLELASGNGSNSKMILRHSLRLISCDGSFSAVRLTQRRLRHDPRGTAQQCILPGQLPAGEFDLVVAAEILYYLTPRQLAHLASRLSRQLAIHGKIVLAHHYVRFADAAQSPAAVHEKFRKLLPFRSSHVVTCRSANWRVEKIQRCSNST